MADAFGISATGFNPPQLVDILAQIQATITTTFGNDVDQSATSVFGQLAGIFAEREMLIWEALQDVYNSQYPDTATGTSLDNVGALTAIKRLPAIASTVSAVKLYGTAGTVIPASTTQFSVANQPTNIFSTNFSVTLGAGQNCIQTLSFSAIPDAGSFTLGLNGEDTPSIAFNAAASDIQTAIQTLPFASGTLVSGNFGSGFTVTFQGAATGGLMSQPVLTVATDVLTSSGSLVTITPAITQAGLDQGSVDVTAVNTGPTVVNIGTLSVIVTPIQGLSAITNPNQAIVGRNVETDNAYRIRRAVELQITGGSTYNALISKLLNVSGVTAVVLFENVTNATDANGLPPHSFEAFVEGGAPSDIGNTIFGTKPIGIQSYGTNEVDVTDSQGNIHQIFYSVPTQVPVYITAQIHTDSSYVANGDALVIQALVNYGDSLGIGDTLIVSPKLVSTLANIPGIDTLTLLVGTSPNPTQSNNITFLANQVGSFDPSRIVVTHV